MDVRHTEIKNSFFDVCKKNGLSYVEPSPLLATKDKTVYFASATITGLKDMLEQDGIPGRGVYMFQPCFRLQNIHDAFYNGEKIRYPGYFIW